MGDLKWSPDTFWRATFPEVFFAIDYVPFNDRAVWESAGWLGLMIHNLNVKRGHQKRSRRELIEFPWDVIFSTTPEDRKAQLVKQLEKNRELIYGKWGLKKFDPANPPVPKPRGGRKRQSQP